MNSGSMFVNSACNHCKLRIHACLVCTGVLCASSDTIWAESSLVEPSTFPSFRHQLYASILEPILAPHTLRLAHALSRQIWKTWEWKATQAAHTLPPGSPSERDLQRLVNLPVGFCGACAYYDDDPLVAGMHWMLSHRCDEHHVILQHVQHAEGVRQAEQQFTSLWRERPECTDLYMQLQWERAIRMATALR